MRRAAVVLPAAVLRTCVPLHLCSVTLAQRYLFGSILDINDPVEGTPFLAQLHVHFTLHVHEHKPSSEADRHHYELSPKGPLQGSLLDLFCSPLYKNVERPHHTGDGDDVEGDRAGDLPPLHPRHIQLLPLVEGFDLGVHDEVELAELARLGVRGLDPLLET